ncbi:MAG TPA: TfoX/Sxy family protein [Alphaproteobacteria bacterium]|nr:TfoX/Sxy family protein [Alphaproteobacteria bacterium]
MAVESDFVATVLDLLSRWGGVSARRMFGGYGIYRQGLMFALVADDVLYMKVDDQNRPAFQEAGMGPFTYDGKSKTVTLPYWEAPSELFDDADAMIAWAKDAFAAALRARKPAKSGKPLIAKQKPARRKITKI